MQNDVIEPSRGTFPSSTRSSFQFEEEDKVSDVKMTESFRFMAQLYQISNQLSGSDVQNLKFLCYDEIPRREAENVKSGFDLFGVLVGKGMLSENKLDFLTELLSSVHKAHLVKNLTDALSNPPPPNYSPPASSSSPSNSMASKKQLQTFLLELGNQLSERNVRDIAFFFQSFHMTKLSVQVAENMREPAQLFTLLKEVELISPTDLSKLREVFDSIGRKDLCRKVDNYLASVLEGGGEGAVAHPSSTSTSYSSTLPNSTPLYNPVQESMGSHRQQQQHKQQAHAGGDSREPPVLMEEQGYQHHPQQPHNPHATQYRTPQMEAGGYSFSSDRFSFPEDVSLQNQPLSSQPRSSRSDGVVSGEKSTLMAIVGGGGGPDPYVMRGTRPMERARGEGQRMGQRTQQMYILLDEKEAKIQEQRQQIAQLTKQNQVGVPHSTVTMLSGELQRKNQELEETRKEAEALRKQVLMADDAPLYNMNVSPPHGKAIVIVNKTFQPNPTNVNLKLDYREGAEKDLFYFKQMFEFLGYSVSCYTDLPAADMHATIEKMALEDHKSNDSLVCCISTHGDETFMYGSDSVGVNRSEFLQPLKQVSTLKDKPKLFFIQACRTRPNETTTDHPKKDAMFSTSLDDADIFIANATTANNPSYRSLKEGSWFVRALHHVFTTQSHSMTLVQMMYSVNSLVCDAKGMVQESHETEPSGEVVRQCAEWTSSFRKGVHFKTP